METNNNQIPAQAPEAAPVAAAKPAPASAPGNRGPRPQGGRGGQGGGRGGRRPDSRDDRPKEEFDQKILELARVTRVTAGGKRMRFRCCLVIGDKKGRVGYAVAKGADVQLAIQKAFNKAKKNVFKIPLVDETIPHEVHAKFGSAVLLLKPAPKGNGIKAGGPLRVVLEMGGVPNVTGKMLGSGHKINNVRAALAAMKQLERHAKAAEERLTRQKEKAAAPKLVAKAKA